MGRGPQCILSLELLGPFRVKILGEEIPIQNWISKKALLLLKYLAAKYGEKTPSDLLIDLFWPDSDFESAGANLHTTVYFLRRVLKEHTSGQKGCTDWIESANGLYWLRVSERVRIDVHDFTRLSRESETLVRQAPLKALEVGLTALELYRGSFLPEDLYADWAEEIRHSLQIRYVELAVRISRLLIEYTRDYKEAARISRQALGQDPYREELHQMLIRSLMALGRYPEAVRQYNSCAKILEEEFGVKPSGETQALLQQTNRPAASKQTSLPTVWGTDQMLVCERANFESILNFEQRRLQRTGQPAVVMTIALDEMAAEKHLEAIFAALAKSMRKNDVVTQWSPRLLLILLPGTDQNGALLVQGRIGANLGVEIASHCRFKNHILSESGGDLGPFRQLLTKRVWAF